MASVLALHFDEPVQFIETIGSPFGWRHAHQNTKRLFGVCIVRNEAYALCDAQDVPVHHKDTFSEIAEI